MAETNQLVKGGSNQQENKHGLGYYIQKIKQGESATWEKDEVLDVIYWWRQLLGLLLGLVWGILPLTGLIGFGMFFGANILFTAMFYRNILGVDEEDYGGHNDFLSEGMPSCIGIFMLTWTLVFTALHAPVTSF